MLNRVAMRSVALVALALLTGCGRVDPAVGNCGPVRSAYLVEGRLASTIENFNSYDLETRYRIYICANQGVNPSMGLSTLFAKGGEESANFLAEKLERTTYDLTIYDIVIVFAVMQSMQTFDASKDPALMGLLEQKVSLLDGALRQWAERYLRTIRNGPGAPLPVPDRRSSTG